MVVIPFLGLPYGLYQITAIDYLTEGDLLDWTNRMGELLDNDASINTYQYVSDQKRRYIAQIVQAVYYLHKHNIVHLDISLENLMRRNGRVCIIDFGLARECKDDDWIVHVSRGKKEYLSPEMLCSKPSYDGRKRDVWSIGICSYALLSHRLLSGYNGDYNKVILELKDGINSFLNKHNPVLLENSNCIDFLEKCLQYKPEDRPLLDELINHKFIRDLTDPKNDGASIPIVIDRPRRIGELHYSLKLSSDDINSLQEINSPTISDKAQRKRYFGYLNWSNESSPPISSDSKNNEDNCKDSK